MGLWIPWGAEGLVKKAQITEGLSIDDMENDNSLRLIDAIPFDVSGKYGYETQAIVNFLGTKDVYNTPGELSFNNDTLLMRKVGNEWKLDVTSYCWRY